MGVRCPQCGRTHDEAYHRRLEEDGAFDPRPLLVYAVRGVLDEVKRRPIMGVVGGPPCVAIPVPLLARLQEALEEG